MSKTVDIRYETTKLVCPHDKSYLLVDRHSYSPPPKKYVGVEAE